VGREEFPEFDLPDPVGLWVGAGVLRLRTLRRGKLAFLRERRSVR
jgi:hypothetical protein